MVHKPDYEPPWGNPQQPEEMEQVHGRWRDVIIAMTGRFTPPVDREGEDWEMAQCGGCSYYIPLDGSIGQDWGVCSRKGSLFDRTAVFEHFGCTRHSHADKLVEKTERVSDHDD